MMTLFTGPQRRQHRNIATLLSFQFSVLTFPVVQTEKCALVCKRLKAQKVSPYSFVGDDTLRWAWFCQNVTRWALRRIWHIRALANTAALAAWRIKLSCSIHADFSVSHTDFPASSPNMPLHRDTRSTSSVTLRSSCVAPPPPAPNRICVTHTAPLTGESGRRTHRAPVMRGPSACY